ncbi:uncharacterized protein EI97DRAFT_454575 [Westerdykella ornata]|uniref:Restriction of telomere capping protein 4 n=1 Tax=Westerdykella ornata TaxID=318751 RepID=A0A6A6K1W1_WESOR|nr:uncharacterized protein EI97DRAFT_454575 [Westerdykella ornata]KAF2281369.1 hypothetical protein EI97DRAFT_454575 [Westerdykella ornata]
MPQLTRNAPPLLTMVGGMPHATSAHHEEDEELIYGDPVSSDDEIAAPVASLPSVEDTASDTATKDASKRGLRRRKPPIRVPPKGAYEHGKKEKQMVAATADAEKENTLGSSQPQSSAEKRKAGGRAEDCGLDFGFRFEHRKPPIKKQKTFRNIHAPTQRKPATFGSKSYAQRKPAYEVEDDDSDLSDVSMVSVKSDIQERPKTSRPARRNKDPELPTPGASVATNRPNLLISLGAYRKDNTPASSQSVSNSTPPSSFAAGETLGSLERYANDIVAETSNATCPLCEEPVDQQHYLDFWQCGKKPTIRQQQLFCREHTKRSALEEYKKRGYPDIDWSILSARVAQHSAFLTAILQNERPSHYRELHAGMGRQTGSKMMESNATLTHTGYYGIRGRRTMMESIGSQLADVIRDQAIKDPVIGSAGGVANFVLRVLVPELAILLVMEDYECSEQTARGIIEESGELGCLVHEELPDEVQTWDSDEDDIEQDEE